MGEIAGLTVLQVGLESPGIEKGGLPKPIVEISMGPPQHHNITASLERKSPGLAPKMVTLNAGGTLVKIFRHMHILLAKRKPSQQGDSIQLRFSQCCAFSFHSLQLFSSFFKKNKGGITKCATPPPFGI